MPDCGREPVHRRKFARTLHPKGRSSVHSAATGARRRVVAISPARAITLVAGARRDLDAAGLLAPIVGHVGDGNFHVLFLLEPGAADERQRAERVYDAMIERALSSLMGIS